MVLKVISHALNLLSILIRRIYDERYVWDSPISHFQRSIELTGSFPGPLAQAITFRAFGA